MFRVGRYTFKIADAAAELDQVHRLNYRTFVREIPQHADTGSGELRDKFHDKNTYIVALLDDGRLAGMLSAHGEPPFSVADRLPDPAVLSAPGVRPLEARLLAVEPGERHSIVLLGLVWILYQHARQTAATHLVISGVAEQQDLYRHMGFEPFGPAAGTGRACYIPMWATLDDIGRATARLKAFIEKRMDRPAEVPGGG